MCLFIPFSPFRFLRPRLNPRFAETLEPERPIAAPIGYANDGHSILVVFLRMPLAQHEAVSPVVALLWILASRLATPMRGVVVRPLTATDARSEHRAKHRARMVVVPEQATVTIPIQNLRTDARDDRTFLALAPRDDSSAGWAFRVREVG
jgi:hypothetical protein